MLFLDGPAMGVQALSTFTATMDKVSRAAAGEDSYRAVPQPYVLNKENTLFKLLMNHIFAAVSKKD